MNKFLICYFSATGTTKKVAEQISSIMKYDLFEIEPEEKYTKEDLDWTNKESRTTIESNDASIRPSIKNKVSNIEDYKNIIIGFPVWWYKEPSIIDTFIEEINLKDKNIYIFVTSGGSSVDSSIDNLRKKYNNLNFVEGQRFSSNVTEDEIKELISKKEV